MSARTLFVGLDAADPRLLQRWAAEGYLPRLAVLMEQAASFDLTNPLGVIGGGVWQELNTGRSCGRAGTFFPARQLHTGESAVRQQRQDEVDSRGFWTVASDAGKRVAVIDLPHTVPPPELTGVFVTEWGTHDRLYGTQSVPPGLVAELSARHGDYPLWSRPWPQVTTAACDAHDGSQEQYEQLLDDLHDGIDRKTALLLDVLGRDEWDLFACAFSEGQCSGHQLWHFLNGDAPKDGRLASGILSVYERLDASLGELVDAAGPEVTVFAIATHAFVEATGGWQLIPEVLVRLGYGSGSGASVRARSLVPPVVRRSVRRVLPARASEGLQARSGTLANPLESSHTKAAALDGDSCSWIRLNLVGREPYGAVAPGSDADAMLADIRAALLELEQPETGDRIVTTIQTAEEAFGADHHPDVPDLIVNFRSDLGVLEACRSSRVGVVRAPLSPTARRTAGHPPLPSKLWATGPRISTSASSRDGKAVDLAATILAQVGVRQPAWLDGSPLI